MPRNVVISQARIYEHEDGTISDQPGSRAKLALSKGKEVPDWLLPFVDQRGNVKQLSQSENKALAQAEDKRQEAEAAARPGLVIDRGPEKRVPSRPRR